jgi:hypothetical protein
MRLYYGRAAGPIQEFLDYDEADVAKTCRHDNWPDLNPKVAERGMMLFAEAMQLAENETVRTRVEKASLCVYRAAIDPVWNRMMQDTIVPLPSDEAGRMKPLVDKFFSLCKKYKVTQLWESEKGDIAVVKKKMETVLGTAIQD